jgi:Ca2+-binding EF-hand superfamily protein
MELKEKFKEIDTDQSGALDIDEFVEAFGDVLGANLT